MKLAKYFLMSLATLTLSTAALAQSYFPPPPPGYGQEITEQRSALLIRRYMNETISLRQLLGLHQNYQNYTVDSVVVEVRGGMVNSSLDLVMNGRLEQSIVMPQGTVTLVPQFVGAVLGQDPHSLRLVVRGVLDLHSVFVNLRTRTNNGFEQRITVPLFAAHRMLGNGRLDLLPLIDPRFYGYRIEAIEFVANSLSISAMLDVVINGYQAAPSVFVQQNPQLSVVRPMDAILGQNVNSLFLQNSGGLDLREVRLQLIGR